jgi:tRNA1(Val) A37 N6-methylase TrmN6
VDRALDDVFSLSDRERERFVRRMLKALAREVRAGRMALKARIPFKREMRDIRQLVTLPVDTFLYADDRTFKRNILGKGSPGSTHTYWSRHQMWKMETKAGNLGDEILDSSPRLIRMLTRLFDPADKSLGVFRNPNKTAVPTALEFLQTHMISGTAFPPFHARFFASQFLPPTGDAIVLDPCAGWGGRLLGTLAVPRKGHVRYYGVDPNRHNKEAYKGLTRRITVWLKREVPGKRSARVFLQPFEDWLASKSAERLAGRVDLAITSPPYFGAEQYDVASRTQSANRYRAYSIWRERFYRAMMDGVFRMLKPGGVFVLNIAAVAEAPRLERDARILARQAGFESAGFYKMAMAILPFAKKPRHSVTVGGTTWKYEPVFVFRKPIAKADVPSGTPERSL